MSDQPKPSTPSKDKPTPSAQASANPTKTSQAASATPPTSSFVFTFPSPVEGKSQSIAPPVLSSMKFGSGSSSVKSSVNDGSQNTNTAQPVLFKSVESQSNAPKTEAPTELLKKKLKLNATEDERKKNEPCPKKVEVESKKIPPPKDQTHGKDSAATSSTKQESTKTEALNNKTSSTASRNSAPSVLSNPTDKVPEDIPEKPQCVFKMADLVIELDKLDPPQKSLEKYSQDRAEVANELRNVWSTELLDRVFDLKPRCFEDANVFDRSSFYDKVCAALYIFGISEEICNGNFEILDIRDFVSCDLEDIREFALGDNVLDSSFMLNLVDASMAGKNESIQKLSALGLRCNYGRKNAFRAAEARLGGSTILKKLLKTVEGVNANIGSFELAQIIRTAYIQCYAYLVLPFKFHALMPPHLRSAAVIDSGLSIFMDSIVNDAGHTSVLNDKFFLQMAEMRVCQPNWTDGEQVVTFVKNSVGLADYARKVFNDVQRHQEKMVYVGCLKQLYKFAHANYGLADDSHEIESNWRDINRERFENLMSPILQEICTRLKRA